MIHIQDEIKNFEIGIKSETTFLDNWCSILNKLENMKTLKEFKNSKLTSKTVKNKAEFLKYKEYLIKYYKDKIYWITKRIQNYKEYSVKLVEFEKIAKKENLICSKSPYSDSYYLHKEDEKISWDGKPENSYRLSDHWDFGSRIHCRLRYYDNYKEYKECNAKDATISKIMICKYNNGFYEEV